MANWLEGLIDYSLHYSNLKSNTIDLTSLVFIKAFASILEDTELLDYLKVEGNNVCSNNFLTSVELINETLDQSKEEAKHNKDLRKYYHI